jgi:hypothetical protein
MTMHAKLLIANVVLVSLIAVLGGCQPVSEPWDSRDHFAQERERSPQQHSALRNRLAQSQGE